LLTSDRPFIMPKGLEDPEAYICVPISPTKLFLAANNPGIRQAVRSRDPSKVTTDINNAVASQARQLVWGIDDSQLRFVQNRIRKAPERQIITASQMAESLATAEPIAKAA